MSTKIFVNIPVKDLDKSMKFFSHLGYRFNRQFTDENAACLVITEDIYSMLITEPFFKNFTKKEIANAGKVTEAIITLSVDSRKEADDLMTKALAAGAKETRPAQDEGWMYLRSFDDLDSHQWEIVWMDPTHILPD